MSSVLERLKMPTRRLLLLSCVLIGIVAFTGRPRAQGPAAAFHAVAVPPPVGGQGTTLIKDATRFSVVIYAVGGGVSRTVCFAPCFKTDTAVLWRFDGTNATLTALPDLMTNTMTNTSQSPLTAFAITPDAAYIASQDRNVESGFLRTRAVRVTTNPLANLNLSTLFSPARGNAAVAISGDGRDSLRFR